MRPSDEEVERDEPLREDPRDDERFEGERLCV